MFSIFSCDVAVKFGKERAENISRVSNACSHLFSRRFENLLNKKFYVFAVIKPFVVAA